MPVTANYHPSVDPEELGLDEIDLIRSVTRESFSDFVKQFWYCVPSAEPLQWNWHMQVLCDEMQVASERVFASQPCEYDEVFNVPFGTSKSTVCSILHQPWCWTRMLSSRHMTGSHTEPLGSDLSSKSLAVIESELYQECFPEVRLVKRGDSHFLNSEGGERRICTVGGKTPTGFHAHFLGIDDPIDPKGALSLAELSNAAKFMTDILPSRKVNKSVSWTYLVMQRLGRGDPSEVMVEQGRKDGAIPVRRVVLPGELTVDVEPKELAKFYVDGLLDPLRMPWPVLKAYKARGAYFYAAQVLQNPLALGGGMFKLTYFNKRVKAAPYQAKRVRFWDRASTEDGGCYSAGVLMCFDGENYFVEHVVHGQWEPDERNRIMRSTALRDRARYGPRYEPRICVEEEGGSSGRDAWKAVARALAGFNVEEIRVSGSKDVRAEPWSCQCAAGNVYLVDNGESTNTGRAEWDIDGYINEHCLFKPDPTVKRLGKWKDQVDGSSGAFNELVGMPRGGSIRVLTTGKSTRGGVRFVVCSKDQLLSTIIEERSLLISILDPIFEEVMCNAELVHDLRSVSPAGTTRVNGAGQETIVSAITPNPGRPKLLHGCNRLLDTLTLEFLDIDPKDFQDKWDVPIIPWGKLPQDLVISKQQAKSIWTFLLKKRDPGPEVVVFQDEGDKRALSVAYAVCDVMRLERNRTIYHIGKEEGKMDGDAPNKYVYDVAKQARGMVI